MNQPQTIWTHDLYICGAAADRRLAEALASSIRAYRMPSKTVLPDPSAGYRRVLTDTAELPLDERGRAVLDSCRCFVVLCSPEARASASVQEHLAYFDETRQRTGVIVVIGRGEPMQVFPPAFIGQRVVRHMLPDARIVERTETIEPVASDLRGTSDRETRRLLRYETIRIVATILGIVPDALEQRHNRRLRRRITMAVSLLGAVLLCSGAVFTWFGIRAMREGQIASLQAELSRASAARLVRDVPAQFADDREALLFIQEGILDTLPLLGEEGQRMDALFAPDGILQHTPGDSLQLLLKKAAVRRATGGEDPIPLYREAAALLGPDQDRALLLRVMETFVSLTGEVTVSPVSYPAYVFLVMKDSGALREGDLLVAIDGERFSYTGDWRFATDYGAGDTDLAGVLHQVMPDEPISAFVLRTDGDQLVNVRIQCTAAELEACRAVCV